MTFKEATDRLLALGLQAEDIADALGVSPQYVRMMRTKEDSPSHRSPPSPDVWRPALAALARTRGEALQRFASDVDAG